MSKEKKISFQMRSAEAKNAGARIKGASQEGVKLAAAAASRRGSTSATR